MKAKLPPYGRRLKDKMLTGWRPTNGVNVYCSWRMARAFPHVCFPPEADPSDFDWTFLAGQEISLINTSGYADYEKLKELSVILVKSGVKNVGLIDVDHPLQWFVPEAKVRVA